MLLLDLCEKCVLLLQALLDVTFLRLLLVQLRMILVTLLLLLETRLETPLALILLDPEDVISEAKLLISSRLSLLFLLLLLLRSRLLYIGFVLLADLALLPFFGLQLLCFSHALELK